MEKAPVGRPRTEANDNDPRLDRMDPWPVRGEGKDHICVMCAMHDTSTMNDVTQVCRTETTPSKSERRP